MKLRTLAMAAAAVVLTLLPACDNDSSKGVVGVQAFLSVNFFPNPVAFSRPGEWDVVVTVTETRGVGVHMYGYRMDSFSAAGVEYQRTSYTQKDFESDFIACGGEGNYIAGGETRCAAVTITQGRNTGHVVLNFFGVDDYGNEVEGTGRLDLL